MDEKKSIFNNSADDALDIKETVIKLWDNKILIAIFALVFALLFCIKAIYFTADTYTAKGVLYVSNKAESYDQDYTINAADIAVSRAVGQTSLEILQTRTFLEQVSKDIGGKYDWRDIYNMMYVVTINETELVQIQVTAYDSYDAYAICRGIVENAPEKLKQVYDGGNIVIVDNVYRPFLPNGKGTVKKTIIGFLLGAILGALYVFMRSFFDTRVRSSSEISKKYGVSILGELAKSANAPAKKRKKDAVVKDGTENIVNDKSDFDTVETLKSIRTNIMFSIPKSDKGKVIVITSAAPGEGKTTTSINIAITFAQMGAKIMLIDCDLRKSRVHRYLKLKKTNGISNVLCGFCGLDDAIKKNVRENLDVLTVGEIPLNPVELLETEEFGKMLDELKEKYDYIFIDTPPMTVVTDAAVIMQKSNGVVVITRENTSTFRLLDETMEDIKRTNTKVLGAVLLDSTEKQKKYRYYHQGKYGYKYKYKYDYMYGDKKDK